MSKTTVEGMPTKMYLTDFTTRANLRSPLGLSVGLREKYKNAVLMVELEGQQADRAAEFSQGDLVRIQNLRAKVGPDGTISAKVGGGDNLIRKLEATSDDPHVVELMQCVDSRRHLANTDGV